MPTVFIAGLAVALPSRFAAGHICDEQQAAVLQDIKLRRIKTKLRALLQRNEINPDELQAKALELNELPLEPYSVLDDDDTDPIIAEALSMARAAIISRMAQEGLPPPKGIDTHAKALVEAMPELQEKARLRVEARYQAAAAALIAIE